MDPILSFILGFLAAFAIMLLVSFIIAKGNADFPEEEEQQFINPKKN